MFYSHLDLTRYSIQLLRCSVFISGFFLLSPAISTLAAKEVHQAPVFLSIKTSGEAKKAINLLAAKPIRISQLLNQSTTLFRENAKEQLNHQLEFGHATDTIYWLGAGLFEDANPQEVNAKLNNIKQKLVRLKQYWQNNQDKLNSLLSLEMQLEKFQFQTRIWLELDEDVYLTGGKADPLVQGKMTLTLPVQPTVIWALGAIKQNTTLSFLAGQTAEQYLRQTSLLNTFSNNDVMVIQPNGQQQKHHVAYWNKTPKTLAPGAIIFVPYQHLPSELSSLNQEISDLLQHRVL